MHIDLGSGEITISYKGKKLPLREPTLDDVKAMEKDKDKEKSMYNFLVKLGMPEDVACQLGIYAMKRFSDQLLAPLKGKK